MGLSEGDKEEFVTHHSMMITYISDIHVQVFIIVILVEGAHHRTLTWTFCMSITCT